MTREEREKHLDWLYRLKSNIFVFMPIDWIIPFADALDVAIKALEQEPTTKNDLVVDLIPRADVLKLMQDNWHTHNGDWAMQESMDDIRALPPVTPQEPKTGHWIPIYQGDEIIDYRCSECEFGNTFGKGTIGMNFCPRCGSDNREVEE